MKKIHIVIFVGLILFIIGFGLILRSVDKSSIVARDCEVRETPLCQGYFPDNPDLPYKVLALFFEKGPFSFSGKKSIINI